MPFNAAYQKKNADELSFLKNKELSDSWKKFIESMPLSKTGTTHVPTNR